MEFSAGIYAALEKPDGAAVVAAQWRSQFMLQRNNSVVCHDGQSAFGTIGAKGSSGQTAGRSRYFRNELSLRDMKSEREPVHFEVYIIWQ